MSYAEQFDAVREICYAKLDDESHLTVVTFLARTAKRMFTIGFLIGIAATAVTVVIFR